MFRNGELGGTDYLSILPCDQVVEYTAAAAFGRDPDYFEPKIICN